MDAIARGVCTKVSLNNGVKVSYRQNYVLDYNLGN